MDIFTISQLAKLVGLSAKTIRTNIVKRKTLKAIKDGSNQYLIFASDAEDFIRRSHPDKLDAFFKGVAVEVVHVPLNPPVAVEKPVEVVSSDLKDLNDKRALVDAELALVRSQIDLLKARREYQALKGGFTSLDDYNKSVEAVKAEREALANQAVELAKQAAALTEREMKIVRAEKRKKPAAEIKSEVVA